MTRRRKSFCWGVSLLCLCLALTLGVASPAGAAGKGKSKPPCRNPIHRLGVHRSSRLHAPLPSVAKLKQAFADKKFQKVVQRVFDVAKLGPVAPELIAAVAALPDDAQPKDVPVGAKLDWMAYRHHGRATVMYDACWLGKDAFKGWIFSLPGPDGGNVGLIVPVPCGNISRIELPVCILKTDKSGDTTLLDLTGSKAGGVPIATYGSTPELPQDRPGVFTLNPPKCEPGANCSSVSGTLWVEDVLGLRSAPNDQCRYEMIGKPVPPVCYFKQITYDNGVFHVDATGSGVAVRTITVTGIGPDGATVRGEMTGDQRTTDIPYTPTKSGDWTFTADVEGVNGLHSAPSCTTTVRVCVPPVAKVALNPPYNCETRQLAVDVNGSSEHRKVTVTGPAGPETLAGNGLTWTYDVKRSGPYTIEVVADDAICPETATATAAVTVSPFGDSARWSLRLFGAYVRASEDTFHETLSGGTPFEERREFKLGGNHGGFGAGVEYRPLHVCDLSRWGVALDVIDAQMDAHAMIDNARGWGMDTDEISFRPVLFSLNYHFTPGRRADFFVGPSIGYAFLGDATFHTLGVTFPERFKDDFIYGLNFGVDVPFGVEHNYAFTAGLRQLFMKADARGPSAFSLDINPTIATAGVAFRFR